MPRPSFVAVLALLTIAVILLLRSFSPQSSFYRDVFGYGHSLTAWLRDEEARYALVVQDRQDLIKKLGPTDIQVEPYPTHGEMYTICAYHIRTLIIRAAINTRSRVVLRVLVRLYVYVYVWDFFIAAFQCPHRVERVGKLGDGGKWVCGVDRVAKQDKCVIYSFGINGESSFEAALLKRAPGCEAWGYDYSVKSWGPEINDDPELRERAHFQAWGLGGVDKHEENDDPKFWTLDSLMELNGHTFIDVLKIDIEGGEFEALTSFLAAYTNANLDGDHPSLPVGQLQLEVHAREGHERFDFFSKWWASLEAAGLRPFWTEPNIVYVNIVRGVRPDLAEYSFINIRGNHALVNEAFN
ncbi:methyltransferase domain-containing protein [Russula compacta]|nr:methyltransferase domain-containing protein [Russula compacta]